MTDEVLNVEDAEIATPEESSVVEEKMLPASRVQELIQKAKLKGREQMTNELEALRAENEALKQNSQSMGGMAQAQDPNALAEQVYQRLQAQLQEQQEAAEQQQMQERLKQMALDYQTRIEGGKGRYEDFDEVMGEFNPAAFPQLVYLATSMDNTADLMYEIAKNPNKLATLAILAERDPVAAQAQMSKMSNAIKANTQALNAEPNINEPLKRLHASPTGQDTGAAQSIADFKKMFRG